MPGFPGEVFHNNPDAVVVDSTKNQIRGIGNFADANGRNALPNASRCEGFIAYLKDVDKAYVYVSDQTDSTNWQLVDNWKELCMDCTTTGGGAVDSVNGYTGVVILNGTDIAHTGGLTVSQGISANTSNYDLLRSYIDTGTTDKVDVKVDPDNKISVDGASGSEKITLTSNSTDVITASVTKVDILPAINAPRNITVNENANSFSLPSSRGTAGTVMVSGGDGTTSFSNSLSLTSVSTTGNVGIGTSSPIANYKLHVLGSSRTALLDNSTLVSIVKLTNSATGNATYNGLDIVAESTNSGNIKSHGMPLVFATSNTNGVQAIERMRITGDGNVGIGTIGPAEKLHVSEGEVRVDAATTNQAGILVNNSTGNKTFELMNAGGPSYGVFNVYFNGAAHSDSQGAKVASLGTSYFNGGNVGIGTTTPSYKLEVSGGDISLPLGNNIRFGGQLGIKKVNNGPMHFYAGTNSTTGGFDFATWNGASYDEGAFVIRNNGNVGIGTTNPNSKLSIHHNGGHTSGTISYTHSTIDLYNPLQADTDEKGSIITFSDNYADSVGYNRTTRAAIKGGTDTTGNTANGFLAFYTDSSGANSADERMRINKDGNVGIGTATPEGKLDVFGDIVMRDGTTLNTYNNKSKLTQDKLTFTRGIDGNYQSYIGVSDSVSYRQRVLIQGREGATLQYNSKARVSVFDAGTMISAGSDAVGNSPYATLHVKSESNSSNSYALKVTNLANNDILRAENDGDVYVRRSIFIDNDGGVADGQLTLREDGGPQMTIKGAGNLTFSTGSTTAGLNFVDQGDGKQKKIVFGSNTGGLVSIGYANNANGDGGFLVQQQNSAQSNGNQLFMTAYQSHSLITSRGFGGTGTGRDMVFAIRGSNTTSDPEVEVMRLTNKDATSPHSVGIGTTTPSERLHVAGKIKIDDGVNPYTLPASDGTLFQTLQTTGTGLTYWSSDINAGAVSASSVSASGNISASNVIAGGITTSTLQLTSGGVAEMSIGSISTDLRITSKGNVDVVLDDNNDETGQKFSVKDPLSTERFSVDDTGVATFNSAFSLPNADGTANQVLSTDGAGAVTWVDQSGGASTDAEIGFAYKTTDQTLTGTFTAISAFDGELFDDLTSFDTTTGALTITDVGHYLINIDVMSNVTSGTGRSGSEIYLEFNGSEVAGSRRGMYNRNNISGYTSASITFPYYHSTGTATFKVMAAQTSGTDTVIIDNCTFSYSTLGGTQGPQGVSGDAFAVSTEAAGRTLVAGDHLKYLRSTSATAVTFTVPPQSSVSWVDNAEIVFEQAGAGQITIAAGSGVTINSSETLKSGQQYAVIGLKRVASDTWTLTGERELAP